MDRISILSSVMDKKVLRILKVFANNPDRDYNLQEVSKASRVPLATTYRILNKLLSLNSIKRTKIKHLKLYSLADSQEAKLLTSLLEEKKSAITAFVEEVQGLEGVQMIIQHGREDRDKANLLVITDDKQSTDYIQSIASKIKVEHSFNIIPLTLAPEQFNQMSSMGLFPGEKKILFEVKP